MTATVDLILEQAKLETEVNVIGAAPIVDITDSSLANTYITKDLLTHLPTAQNTHAILNLAPGVTQLSAYGGGDQSGNSWTIDGAEVSSSWFGGGQYSTPIDYNVVEEQQVIALGAPAEYGGFTGTAINIVTKSGGNEFHGDAQVLYRGDSWQSANIKSGDGGSSSGDAGHRVLQRQRHWAAPSKDKLWFFAGYGYYKQTIAGGLAGPEDAPEVLKLTFQPTQKDRSRRPSRPHLHSPQDPDGQPRHGRTATGTTSGIRTSSTHPTSTPSRPIPFSSSSSGATGGVGPAIHPIAIITNPGSGTWSTAHMPATGGPTNPTTSTACAEPSPKELTTSPAPTTSRLGSRPSGAAATGT
jgi:hypothetical protein